MSPPRNRDISGSSTSGGRLIVAASSVSPRVRGWIWRMPSGTMTRAPGLMAVMFSTVRVSQLTSTLPDAWKI